MKKINKLTLITGLSIAVPTVVLSAVSCFGSANNGDSSNKDTSPIVTTITSPESDEIRLGTWNILNYAAIKNYDNPTTDSNKKSKQLFDLRTEIIARTILSQQMDVIGLTEINETAGDDGVASKTLEVLLVKIKELDPDSNWEGEVSDLSVGAFKNSAERYIYLWKSSKLKPVDLNTEDTNKNGILYSNEAWKGTEYADQDYQYVRPPYAMTFETVGEIKNTFSLLTIHIDPNSVTSSRNEKKTTLVSNQGNQDVEEALHASEVVKWLDVLDGDNNEIIFMGDTNITLGNESKTFKPLIDLGYKNQLGDSEEAKTSLSTTLNKYAQPYDKLFYKGDLITNDINKLDLWNITAYLTDWSSYRSQYETIRGKVYDSDAVAIRSIISDHTLVSFDLKLNANDNT